ncbi:MAG: GTP-binding protein [Lachnospiraceae bacterium]|nr:GTP-binding protein [Lachnospiraceae bacterium]
MIKVDIISGFLGAGKTTLIKKLIAEVFAGKKIVLIENEFGEIGIDGGFLKDAGINITEMNSGCICCSLVGDFGKALKEVAEQFSPDRIIIEPSGVGKLSDVRKAVEGAAQETGLELNALTTVADASKIKMYMKNFGEFYNNQIESAATVILSRTQKLSEEKQLEAAAMIREKNPNATIITTPWDELTGAQILSAMEETDVLAQMLLEETAAHTEEEEEYCCHGDHEHHHDHDHEEHGECCCHDHDHDGHHHHHHHHADEVFTSWGQETPRKYTKNEVEEILQALGQEDCYGTVLRAKGMLPATDGSWIHFDFVPEEYEIRTGAADYTGRFCVIGAQLNEQKLAELFHLV